jgi:hypothetical protein
MWTKNMTKIYLSGLGNENKTNIGEKLSIGKPRRNYTKEMYCKNGGSLPESGRQLAGMKRE